ncbi:MAG: PRC-barrel domain-containing protein [Nanoarchaeota archaeon]|nr:PRC-barrel domain-containing protein [Nanoarchaeota archaeon]
MAQKSISSKDLDKALTSDDVLGKEIIDSVGSFIGIAEKVFIDPNDFDFIGVGIDKGFLKKGLAIGRNYIEKITKYAVFLNIRVAFEIRGMEVFDKDGKDLGIVSEIELVVNTNKISSIGIKKGIFGKKIIIPYNFVERVGDNVLLNTTKKEIFASIKNG